MVALMQWQTVNANWKVVVAGRKQKQGFVNAEVQNRLFFATTYILLVLQFSLWQLCVFFVLQLVVYAYLL